MSWRGVDRWLHRRTPPWQVSMFGSVTGSLQYIHTGDRMTEKWRWCHICERCWWCQWYVLYSTIIQLLIRSNGCDSWLVDPFSPNHESNKSTIIINSNNNNNDLSTSEVELLSNSLTLHQNQKLTFDLISYLPLKQWRHLQFFDSYPINPSNPHHSSLLNQPNSISTLCSGHASLAIAHLDGQISILDQSFQLLRSWIAFPGGRASLLRFTSVKGLLVSIGVSLIPHHCFHWNILIHQL